MSQWDLIFIEWIVDGQIEDWKTDKEIKNRQTESYIERQIMTNLESLKNKTPKSQFFIYSSSKIWTQGNL